MLKEFREFAMKGNVVDLAIGVIIGAAFGAIVSSVVTDLFMPVVGAVFGGLDFSNHFIPLASNVTATSLAAAREQGAVLAYGHFLTVVINFLIIAWILFLVVKGINRFRRSAADVPPPPAPPTREELLLTEIRDILSSRN
ncbi:large conductance mechanosensitive channel protein MscL [Ancylobacter lacus]|uniref:large conductance mechanosensitive channel protein MscL n=1 Tax=Ancylobacter lacus TaxID=2579970 RepID=UPI001BD043F9|nr:large conductance mechanosensitive channel protein MscL [Ancylobacter lacus]MBS7539071.1 large conductance mechanosensitive channel protein MscL [Ancylobacter lacus]